MPRGRRVELSPVFVLHHRPWRDTSRMLEVFAREQGRLTLFARGVRGPRSRSASLLQPFVPLLASWTGSGETAQLNQVEAAPEMSATGLPPAALMPAWYLNELLMKLVLRADPQPAVFDLYAGALARLRRGDAVAAVLRGFERDLLGLLGFGLELRREAQGGAPLQDDRYYHFHPDLGFVGIHAEAESAYPGRSLLALADDDLQEDHVLEDARRLMRTALDHALEGRELRTRAVARAVTRRASRAATEAAARTRATASADGAVAFPDAAAGESRS
jgi:DNA repair protein RecO (recombination protein O)